jgi:hypothetical protein
MAEGVVTADHSPRSSARRIPPLPHLSYLIKLRDNFTSCFTLRARVRAVQQRDLEINLNCNLQQARVVRSVIGYGQSDWVRFSEGSEILI